MVPPASEARTVVLVLGGEVVSPGTLRETSRLHDVYVADGGARTCLDAGVTPVMVVGDFDSIREEELPAAWHLRPRPDQNRTDFEKLLAELPDDCMAIEIFGGMGGRLDHQWTNLLIAAHQIPAQIRVRFHHGDEVLVRVTPACGWCGEGSAREKTLSLLPIGSVEGVKTEGLVWDLQDASLGGEAGSSQSNRMRAEIRASVTVRSGCLMLWHQAS